MGLPVLNIWLLYIPNWGQPWATKSIRNMTYTRRETNACGIPSPSTNLAMYMGVSEMGYTMVYPLNPNNDMENDY